MLFSPTSPPASHIRILLIEDNEISCQLMSDYLEHCGWQVFSLVAGAAFGKAIANFHPNIILLDLKLPDIDGFTILERIQNTSNWCTIPVIVVSAYAFQSDQQRALELGARQYLVKPVRLPQLVQAIQHELEQIERP